MLAAAVDRIQHKLAGGAFLGWRTQARSQVCLAATQPALPARLPAFSIAACGTCALQLF